MRDYPEEIKWLKKKSPYLSKRAIEKKLNIPQGTLNKFVKGERGLDEQWWHKVSKWVQNFKK